MPSDSVTRTALRWTPQGRRLRGRPKETWRRTVEKEVRSHGFTLDEAPKMAADRARWKSYILRPRKQRGSYKILASSLKDHLTLDMTMCDIHGAFPLREGGSRGFGNS
ncbi:hypothetical protein Bbelb_057800 [Branchiostoma belcheri]|nr:hypothetical protein Bbelb_057800 [Branchiostoma belcheri]